MIPLLILALGAATAFGTPANGSKTPRAESESSESRNPSRNGNILPLIYSNPFIGGSGSYEGALLVGEGLQSKEDPILQNSGQSTELAWVQSVISGNFPDLPEMSVTPGGESAITAKKTYLLTLSPGWEYGYFMAKWGRSDNTSDHALWLIKAGETLAFQLPNGISHSELWYYEPSVSRSSVASPSPLISSVPEGGSTILLFCAATFALGCIRRKR